MKKIEVKEETNSIQHELDYQTKQITYFEKCFLQIRKALTGDIHNNEDLLDVIEKNRLEKAELKAKLDFMIDSAQLNGKERDSAEIQVKKLEKVLRNTIETASELSKLQQEEINRLNDVNKKLHSKLEKVLEKEE